MRLADTTRQVVRMLGAGCLDEPRASIPRLARFALVGISGIGVNSAVITFLVEIGRLSPVVAGALATEAAILSNFTLHDRWTFRGQCNAVGWPGRAARYNLAALGGLVINVAVLAGLTGWLHLHYLVANVVAIGAAFAWNYVASCRFAWMVVGSDETSAPGEHGTIPLLAGVVSHARPTGDGFDEVG